MRNPKTYVVKAAEVNRKWYVVDAAVKPLGRLASDIAIVLRGKHKPNYQPNLDMGDYVIVINAEKVVVTGRKLDQKFYYRHSGYPGGMKVTSLRDQLRTHPERVIQHAVWGMLPHNRLARAIIKKLHVYSGPAHVHQAQRPEPFPQVREE